MNIAIIETKLNLETGGGSNIHLHVVASELVKLGHDVTVITLSPSLNKYPDNLPYSVIREGLLTNRIDRHYSLELYRVLRKYENQFDIYHLWSPGILLGGALYRMFRGKVPVVVNILSLSFCSDLSRINMSCARHCGLVQRTMHRTGNPVKKALLMPIRLLEDTLEILMANHVDAFIPTDELRVKLFSWQHWNTGKMTVIPISIEYEKMRLLQGNHRSGAFANGAYNILYAGRLVTEKGPDILIKAIPKLDFPVCLHIAGDGSQRKELELLVKELGISDRVIFHGWVAHEKMTEYYLSAQLFVHPPRWPELCCTSVIEAMVLGTPIIMVDFDVTSELDGIALLFKRADADDLVEKIKLLHHNPSLAASLAKKAREKAIEFDYTRVVPKYIEVYKSAIKGTTKSQV